MDWKNIEDLVDKILAKTKDLNFLICELKKNNVSQGQTHFILSRKLKNVYSFHEIGEKIINSECWKEVLEENQSIENDINSFLEKE
ncbi:hypothetical protein [uncultured Chryseobacterium sp.]|uniref:hypothetical protein n=1 Tax=uncultured Chryseobacterium sp. TaxID=259322 RepID=UPI0025832B66|nr:hypothetical protein [uncultured Chryseobacterium sp.]